MGCAAGVPQLVRKGGSVLELNLDMPLADTPRLTSILSKTIIECG